MMSPIAFGGVASGTKACLHDSQAVCNRLWVAQADGLHAAYGKTLLEPAGPGPIDICEHCARNQSAPAA